jgi:hypothetical protein
LEQCFPLSVEIISQLLFLRKHSRAKYFHYPTKEDGYVGVVAVLEDRVILTISQQAAGFGSLAGRSLTLNK